MAAELQTALGTRYRIEREIGRGGMATVYLAEDTKHGRLVALKVLHPELAAAVGPQRFRREITIAAQLQHPHILPLLDSGEAPASGATGTGPLWFTMPYVVGESLRQRLAVAHQLPLAEALAITREVAQALEYAHRQGVVHRDVKPENILVARDGGALLADFGLARDLAEGGVRGASGGSGGRRLTESGLSVGTLEYMSPEQMTGQRDVDARTDVYALGCVLYEMLAGEPPFTGATPQALVARRLVERPLPVRAVRDRIPVGVERAIEIALARAPADRYQSAGEFADALARGEQEADTRSSDDAPAARLDQRDILRPAPPSPWDTDVEGVLRRHSGDQPARVSDASSRVRPRSRWRIVAAGVVIASAAAVGAYAWFERTASTAHPLMLAVLPFENVGDGAVGYFTDGITDEIRGDLSRLPGLQVIARGSSVLYGHGNKPPEQIARELGVSYLLTGQVRWAKQADGAMIASVEPELIRAMAGRAPTVYWQQRFDVDPTNALEVQGDIASNVASVLHVVAGATERQALLERPTNNAAAYDAYLQGEAATQGLTTTDPPAMWRGIGYYTKAATADSTFLFAWTRLSRSYARLYANSTPTPANADAAQRALEHAEALAPDRLETQIALSDYVSLVEHDERRAYAILSALLQRYPDNVQLIGGVSVDERRLGRWDDALAHAQRAAKLDPLSPVANRQLASTLLRMRRFPDAAVVCRHGMELAPTNLGTIERMALVSLAQGDLARAQAVVRSSLATVDTTRLLVFFATTGDLFWVLTDAQQRFLLALPPAAYDDDRASWASAAPSFMDSGATRPRRGPMPTRRGGDTKSS